MTSNVPKEDFEIIPRETRFCEKVRELARRYVPGWERVDEIQIQRMNNALSNDVFVLEQTESGSDGVAPKKALLRIYGKQMERIVCKEREIELAMKLSSEHLGPTIYVLFQNGRLEEFIRCGMLDTTLMRQEEVVLKVANKLSKMHNWLTVRSTRKGPSRELFDRIDKWLCDAKNAMGEFSEQQLCKLSSVGFPSSIEKVWKEKRSKFELNPECFVHCDLQYGNILISKTNEEAVFIDFEYALYAPAQFDIANYWCEWAADYSDSHHAVLDWRLMPTALQKQLFVDEYNREKNEIQDTQKFIRECEEFEMVSHLHWALWGLLKCSKECEFDYFEYAIERLQQIHIN